MVLDLIKRLSGRDRKQLTKSCSTSRCYTVTLIIRAINVLSILRGTKRRTHVDILISVWICLNHCIIRASIIVDLAVCVVRAGRLLA